MNAAMADDAEAVTRLVAAFGGMFDEVSAGSCPPSGPVPLRALCCVPLKTALAAPGASISLMRWMWGSHTDLPWSVVV